MYTVFTRDLVNRHVQVAGLRQSSGFSNSNKLLSRVYDISSLHWSFLAMQTLRPGPVPAETLRKDLQVDQMPRSQDPTLLRDLTTVPERMAL
jgi:hypothetical protein